MNITIDSSERVEDVLAATVTVSADDVDAAVAKAYKDISYKYNFQGFRKGRTPRPVIDSRVSREGVLANATNNLINAVEPIMLDELDVVPVTEVKYEEDLAHVEEGEQYTLKVTMQLGPMAELSSYDAPEIEMPPKEVTEAEIAEQLDQLTNLHATLEDLEEDRAVLADDIVQVDIADVKDASAFAGKGRIVDLTRPVLPKELSQQFVGMKPGEEKEITFAVPVEGGASPVSDQHDEKGAAEKDTAEKDTAEKDTAEKDTAEKDTAEKDTAEKDTAEKDTAEKGADAKGASNNKKGDASSKESEPASQDVVCKVSIVGLKFRKVPELTDDFIKKSFGFDSFDALKDAIKSEIEMSKTQRLPSLKEERIVDVLTKRLLLEEVPSEYAEVVFKELGQSFVQQLSQSGLSLDEFLQRRNIGFQQLMDDLRAQANDRARQLLALNAFAREEGFEATEEDVIKELKSSGTSNSKETLKRLRADGRLPAIREAIRRAKAIAWLVEHAVVTEVDEVARSRESRGVA